MPPRPRTPVAPSRRPRVAGLRDPRRQDGAETQADDATATTAPAVPAVTAPDRLPPSATPQDDDPTDGDPQDRAAAGTTPTAPDGSATAGAAPSDAPAPADDPAPGGEATAEETTVAAPAKVDTTKPAPGAATGRAATTGSPADSTTTASADGTTTATPTRASRPRPTGRADRTRRPAPSSGRAPRPDERRERDRPRGRTGGALAAVGAGTRRFTRTRVAFPVALVVVVLVAGTLATLAFLGGRAAYQDGPIANSAVVDAAATAEVVGASRQVVEQALSYDYTKLDDSATAARTLGTGPFLAQYPQVYDSAVRPAATQQQLRQTATVLNIGVRRIEGDRANVIVFAQFTLQRAGGQSATSAGLLDLTMAREDGRWKLFDFKPLTAAP